MAIVKETSYLHAPLLTMKELQVMALPWNPKRIYYQRELNHRQDVMLPFLIGPVTNIYHHPTRQATKPETLRFGKQKVPAGTLSILFNSAFGRIHADTKQP